MSKHEKFPQRKESTPIPEIEVESPPELVSETPEEAVHPVDREFDPLTFSNPALQSVQEQGTVAERVKGLQIMLEAWRKKPETAVNYTDLPIIKKTKKTFRPPLTSFEDGASNFEPEIVDRPSVDEVLGESWTPKQAQVSKSKPSVAKKPKLESKAKRAAPLEFTEKGDLSPVEQQNEEAKANLGESWTPKTRAHAFTETEAKPEAKASEETSSEKIVSSHSIFGRIAEAMGADKERASMHAAEANYLDAYKSFYKNNNALERIGGSRQLDSFKDKYLQSRLEYQNALRAREGAHQEPLTSAAFEKRMRAQYEKLEASNETPKGDDGEKLSVNEYVAKSIRQREESVAKYLTFREVVRPVAQKRIEARKEALDAKGRNVFEKSLSYLGQQNKKLEKKFGKTGARAIRALASTVVIGGVAAGSGAFATAGGLGILGYGTYKFARSFGGTILGAGAGGVAGELYEQFRGRKVQSESKEKLKTAGKKGIATSKASLARMDAQREKLIKNSSEVELQKKKALVTALTALGVGAGASAAFAEMASIQHAGDLAAQHVHAVPEQGPAHPVTGPKIVHENAPAQAATVAEKPLPPIQVTHGEGADAMFADLHKHLSTGYAHPEHSLVDTILKAKPHELTRLLGFPENNAEGYLHPGDTLTMDGSKLVFHHSGHTYTLLEQVTDKNGVHTQVHHDITKLYPHAGEHHAPVHHGAAHHTSQQPEQAPAKAAAPTPDTSSSQPVETPAPETPSAPAPVEAPPVPEVPIIDHAPPSIDALTHGSSWNDFNQLPAENVFAYPVDPGTPADTFRGDLFGILRESGVGPVRGETIAQYAERASHAINEHAAKGLSDFDSHVAIYASNGRLVAHGGDLDARLMLAREYALIHPQEHIIVENPDVGSKVPIVVSADTIGSDASSYNPYTGKLIAITENNKVVY